MKYYVLNTPEYEALDKVLTRSHLNEHIELRQRKIKTRLFKKFPNNTTDYFRDWEDNKNLTLKQGLVLIYDAAIDYRECYRMTDKEIDTFDKLLIKFGVKDNASKLI